MLFWPEGAVNGGQRVTQNGGGKSRKIMVDTEKRNTIRILTKTRCYADANIDTADDVGGTMKRPGLPTVVAGV